MLKTRRQRVLIIMAVLMVCLLGACTMNQRPGPTTPNTPEMQDPRSQPQPSTQSSDDQRVQPVVQKVEQEVKEINSATVIIAGNQAWIGIDAKANAEISDQTKEKIANVAKEADKGIQTVYVTADIDTVTRLRNIANDIATGKPISGFLNELAEIGNRISPMPR